MYIYTYTYTRVHIYVNTYTHTYIIQCRFLSLQFPKTSYLHAHASWDQHPANNMEILCFKSDLILKQMRKF